MAKKPTTSSRVGQVFNLPSWAARTWGGLSARLRGRERSYLSALRRSVRARMPRFIAGTRWPRLLVIAIALLASGGVLAAVLLIRTIPTRLDAAPALLHTSADAAPLPRPTTVITFSDGCLSSRCHTPLHAATLIHAATRAGACDLCHLPDAGGHTYPLLDAPETLCTNCHKLNDHAIIQHGALQGDARAACLACHDPHASPPGERLLLTSGSVERTCLECHALGDASSRHSPFAVGHCDACHDPHGAASTALLRTVAAADAPPAQLRPTSDHCRLCHQHTVEVMAAATHSHFRLDDDCLACHSAHAADMPRSERQKRPVAAPQARTSLMPRPAAPPHNHSESRPALITEPLERCLDCHAGIAAAAFQSSISHQAVLTERRCIACHDPHASESAAMLRATGNEEAAVCLQCHSKPVIALDGRQIPDMTSAIEAAHGAHGPVSAGQCSLCHSVHGGNHARLLNHVNPRVLATQFDTRNYALCFSCHDQQLALADSEVATQFRHGRTNLHRLHLDAGEAGERSRSCASCHAIHSSPRPRLIAERVAYEGSDWTMPMNFQLTSDGGSCAPGCHEPMQYRRTPSISAGNPRPPERSSP